MDVQNLVETVQETGETGQNSEEPTQDQGDNNSKGNHDSENIRQESRRAFQEAETKERIPGTGNRSACTRG